MADIGKLSTLLDDPEIRELIFGLAHVGPAAPGAGPGAYDDRSAGASGSPVH